MAAATNHAIWAGALTLLLVHQETGCPHSARQAARLLARIADSEGLDDAVCTLVERASLRLDAPPSVRLPTGP